MHFNPKLLFYRTVGVHYNFLLGSPEKSDVVVSVLVLIVVFVVVLEIWKKLIVRVNEVRYEQKLPCFPSDGEYHFVYFSAFLPV